MFAKLLKHEWRATKGIIGLLCVVILISGLTIGGVMSHVATAEEDIVAVNENTVSSETAMSDFEEILCIFLMIAGIMAVAVCGAASVFAVIYRFYKSRFTDEGYLTFTLPVSNHQLLLSSILNSIFGVLLVMLACFTAVAIAMGMFVLAINQEIIWADVWAVWEEVWQQIVDSFWKNADQFSLLGFSAVVSSISQLIVLMLSVTIGAVIAKKHKILAAVGVYYGISFAQSLVSTMFAFTVVRTEDVQMMLGFPGLLSVVTGAAGYLLMYYLTSRKLNLT